MRCAPGCPLCGIPVISLGDWQLLDADGTPLAATIPAADPADAVARALASA